MVQKNPNRYEWKMPLSLFFSVSRGNNHNVTPQMKFMHLSFSHAFRWSTTNKSLYSQLEVSPFFGGEQSSQRMKQTTRLFLLIDSTHRKVRWSNWSELSTLPRKVTALASQPRVTFLPKKTWTAEFHLRRSRSSHHFLFALNSYPFVLKGWRNRCKLRRLVNRFRFSIPK